MKFDKNKNYLPVYYLFLMIMSLCLHGEVEAQNRSSQFQFSFEKKYEFQKNWELKLTQTFQVSPDFSDTTARRREDLEEIDFVDLYLISRNTENDDDDNNNGSGNDDDDDDDDDENNSSNGSGRDTVVVGIPASNNPSSTDWAEILNPRSMTIVTLKRELVYDIDGSVGYQANIRPENDYHTLFADLTTTRKLGKILRFSPRIRFQSTGSPEDGGAWQFTHFLRFRARFSLKGDFSPYAEGEMFYRFKKADNEWRTFRLSGGANAKLNKHYELRVFYQFQQRLNSRDPETGHLLSARMTYEF
ncbi:MAG: DUF2490 domain-containing protein [Bacteroidia bacterium]|nr:DUF2490 domain-containing protein [Bacteroidia bacterium]